VTVEMTENVKENKGPNGITFKMVMIILISVTIVLILTTIKIWMSNQIYYESKKVNNMQREVSALKAEKVLLQQNIEALKFKNRVTDTIFIIDNTDE
jgi:cell division protein FtsL